MTELEITEFSGRVKTALERAVVLSEKAVSEYYCNAVNQLYFDHVEKRPAYKGKNKKLFK